MVSLCGIFGISYGPQGAAGEEWSPSDFAQIMFPAIIHRGPHAWGWMSYNPATGISIEKHVGRADTPAAIAKMNLDEDPTWLVGHVRFATHGDPKNLNNNHPLVHGSIVGVHNGVLRNHESILKDTGREKDNTQVDSEAIFAAVHKWGMRGGLTRIHGDMVAVFASTKHPAVLRIARSHGRPMVYATTTAGSLVFASECCVIDATGIALKGGNLPYTELTGRNRLLTVRQGVITERVQYRSDSWKQFQGTSARPYVPSALPLPGRKTSQEALAEANAARQKQVYRSKGSGSTTSGGPRGLIGTTGDQHLGNGVYRTADGRQMSVDEYVDYRVEQALQTIQNND